MAEDKKLSMTQAELDAYVESKIGRSLASEKQTPEEKRLRQIIREESKATFVEALGEVFDFGDDKDSDEAGENDGGGDTGLKSFAKMFLGAS